MHSPTSETQLMNSVALDKGTYSLKSYVQMQRSSIPFIYNTVPFQDSSVRMSSLLNLHLYMFKCTN